MCIGADVTSADALRDAVAETKQKFGEINGVIHAAGIVNDALIATKNQGDTEAVFAAKVYGTEALHQAVKEEPLDFLVLCSSTSTAIAPVGQVDYVAANSYLNAFASAHATEARRVVSLNWGIWARVGMAASAAA
jgi:NAD(P)-dependent dehydrogenase (short-subunit alcohol dehydrogenase family)